MDLQPAPSFRQVWPGATEPEEVTNVLAGIAQFGGKEHQIRLGFMTRTTSGKDRSRSLVLVDRYPTVEFVADHENVQPEEMMASIIKDRNGKHIPVGGTVPAEYAGMNVGPYRSVVVGPGARNGLAVICAASDSAAMVKHALIRTQFREERAMVKHAQFREERKK